MPGLLLCTHNVEAFFHIVVSMLYLYRIHDAMQSGNEGQVIEYGVQAAATANMVVLSGRLICYLTGSAQLQHHPKTSSHIGAWDSVSIYYTNESCSYRHVQWGFDNAQDPNIFCGPIG